MRDSDPLFTSELSEKQRQVLDLVASRKSSKEIARILGISKHTVDQRIALARQKYGAANRNELVNRYLASGGVCDRIAYDPMYLSDFTPPNDGDREDEQQGPIFSVADVRGFVPSAPRDDFGPIAHPLASLDRRFGVFGRVGAICLLALLLAISLLAMVSIARTLSDLL